MIATLRNTAFIVGAAMLSACGASQSDVNGADVDRNLASITAGNEVTDNSINQRFGNLDEYLAHLEKMNAPIDKPWYRQIRPGVYELQTGNLRRLGGDSQKRTFTREELEQKFGFSR